METGDYIRMLFTKAEEYMCVIVNEWSKTNKALASIASSLEKQANPVIKLDPDDPDTVKNSSQSIGAHRRRLGEKADKRVRSGGRQLGQ